MFLQESTEEDIFNRLSALRTFVASLDLCGLSVVSASLFVLLFGLLHGHAQLLESELNMELLSLRNC